MLNAQINQTDGIKLPKLCRLLPVFCAVQPQFSHRPIAQSTLVFTNSTRIGQKRFFCEARALAVSVTQNNGPPARQMEIRIMINHKLLKLGPCSVDLFANCRHKVIAICFVFVKLSCTGVSENRMILQKIAHCLFFSKAAFIKYLSNNIKDRLVVRYL